MIHIPSQIHGFQFVKVLAGKKEAFEPGAPRYDHTDPELIKHLETNGNYGVSGDEQHVIVDSDSDELAVIIRSQLPRTFTVTSATKQKPHFYFKCRWTRGDIALTDWTTDSPKAGNIGTVRRNGYVVGPFSQVDGRQYLIDDLSPVAEIAEEKLSDVLVPWIAKKAQIIDQELWKGQGLDFPITKISSIRGGLQVHPVHGSKSNSKNLSVEAEKNLWYCFACCAGGDSLQLLAVMNKIIGCWEAGPGALRAEKFKEAKRLAIELGHVKDSEAKFVEKQKGGDKETQGGARGQAAELIRLALEAGPELFHDQRRAPYVKWRSSPPRILALHCSEIKAKLAGLLWDKRQTVPGSEALNSALNVLEHKALNGSRVKLHTRICWDKDAIWLDLADEEGRAVKITSRGWSIEEPPTLFRRYGHQQPIIIPTPGGDPWRLMNHANVSKADQLLVMTQVGCLFIPEYPHPVWNHYGSQGSAKSTLHKMVKTMIDPSVVGLLTMPRDERELVQLLDHHYLCAFDNVTHLPGWAADAFCRATTGLGFSKRQLYTDDSDIIYQLMRPVGLNGINITARTPDLLDRSLLTEAPTIPDEKKLPESETWSRFNADLPSILGGFLDAAVKALQMPEPRLERNYRMADFVSWGFRMAQALAGKGEDFIASYANNVRAIAKEAVDADILGEPILTLLKENSDWDGAASQLLDDLRNRAEQLKISTRQKAWPKTADALGRRLRRLKEPLRHIGVSTEFGRTEHARTVTLRRGGKVLENVSAVSEASAGTGHADTNDASDTSSQSLNGYRCEVCGKPGTPLSRIGESGVRVFCKNHLSNYGGDL